MVQIKGYQGGRSTSVQQPVGVQAVRGAMEGAGDALRPIGQMFYNFQDEVDTADAKVADSQFSKAIQDSLYSEGSGYMYASGRDAIGRREGVISGLEKLKADTLAKMSPRAAAHANGAIEARYNQAVEGINRHASTEGRTYLNDASQARIEMFASDAVYKPDQRDIEMKRADAELADMAQRNGWSPEVYAVKRKEMRSNVHSNIIRRISNTDAAAAISYLDQNKDDMTGEEVARLESALAPLAKEQRGRRLGAAAAMGGVAPQYINAVIGSESGGNANAKNPLSSATGIGQFITSTWNSLAARYPELGLTPDGRTDPKQSRLALLAFTKENADYLSRNGLQATGGNLYAAHFLGSGGAVSVLKRGDGDTLESILPAGVISANPFLRGKTVGWFRQWSNEKGGGPQVMVGGVGAEAILDISDPAERDAALTEYNLRSGIQAKQVEAARDSAQQAAFEYIESGQSVDDLSLEFKNSIGMSGMSALRSYQNTIATGNKVKTNDAVYVDLMAEAASDPDSFAKRDPLTYRNDLSDEDFKSMVRKRQAVVEKTAADAAKATVEAKDMKITEARTAVSTALDAAGFDTNKQAGAQVKSKMEAEVLRWADAFSAQEKRAPTPQEINKRVADLLVPVAITQPGSWFNSSAAPAVSVDLGGERVIENGDIKFRNPVTLDTLQKGKVKIGDLTVPPAHVSEFITAFTERYNAPPTAKDVIEGLIASGEYN